MAHFVSFPLKTFDQKVIIRVNNFQLGMHQGLNAEDSNVSNGETNVKTFGDEGKIRKENRKI